MQADVDRQQWLEQGYLIRHNVIPPDQLDAVRASYETLLERQKTIWADEREPGDPPGGVWEKEPQPRIYLLQWGGHYVPDLVDESTANAFELWLSDNVLGVSSELLGIPEVPIFMFSMMCSPIRDRGPSHWHRDVSTEMGPLKVLQEDVHREWSQIPSMEYSPIRRRRVLGGAGQSREAEYRSRKPRTV